jgi:hypothetical protein
VLVYLATAYSQVEDKDELLSSVLRVIARLTETYREEKWHFVTPLFNHFVLPHSSTMGSDYSFWRDYSQELLSKSDLLIIVKFQGMNLELSTGVQDEIALARSLGKSILFTSEEV